MEKVNHISVCHYTKKARAMHKQRIKLVCMSEYLRRTHLEKEGAAFVGNFKNSGPRENICFYLILINHQSLRAHAEHHICTADILSTNQIY